MTVAGAECASAQSVTGMGIGSIALLGQFILPAKTLKRTAEVENASSKILIIRHKSKGVGMLRIQTLNRHGLRKLHLLPENWFATPRAQGIENARQPPSPAVTAPRSLLDIGLENASSARCLDNSSAAGLRWNE